ncbi:hypothetical protein LT493_25310 [Streptomyces tricolor]|nr:hypothetical protein [Streptomyces tricolor]
MDGVGASPAGADQALRASVTTDAPVVPVREGGTARVKVTVATTGEQPLTEPVTVTYATADGTAASGTDYTPVSGTLTFPGRHRLRHGTDRRGAHPPGQGRRTRRDRPAAPHGHRREGPRRAPRRS